MSRIIFLFYVFLNTLCFCQNTGNTISTATVFELLIKPSTTLNQSKIWADSLSDRDYKSGKKQILIKYGMFSNGCTKCILSKYGFSSFDFAPDDLTWENVDAFIKIYNQNMHAHLKKKAQEEIFRFFNAELTTFFDPNELFFPVKPNVINEFQVSLQFDFSSLERLFKKDCNLIKIGFIDSLGAKNVKMHSFTEIKEKGFEMILPANHSKKVKINVILDFSLVPDKFEICWCSSMDKLYYYSIPLIFN